MAGLQTFLSFIFVFGLLVIAHEFGHFMLARLNGIRVHEFSVGMGPKLYSIQGKQTLYSIRALPLGGYVQMHGESEAAEDPDSFSQKKPLQRFSVLVAGSAMNFITAVLLFFIVIATVGFPTTTVQEALEGYPAQMAGIQAGDTVKSIDGTPVETWDELIKAIAKAGGKQFPVEVERNGESLTFQMETKQSEDGRQIIGILHQNKRDFGRSFGEAFLTTGRITVGIFGFLGDLFQGKASTDGLVGPVGIVGIVGEASKNSFISLLEVAGMISVNLGIFNLLPFPALDGGRIVFVLYEMIFRKPFNQNWEQQLHYFGFLLLLALMVLMVFKDLKMF